MEREHGAIDIAVGIILIPLAVFFGSFLLPEPEWDPTPRAEQGRLVFDPHYNFHPNNYTFNEKVAMGKQISFISLVTDPQHLGTFPWLYRFEDRANIGNPAPVIDLPTTDGGHLRLVDQRGKINVFMFVALTCPPARHQLPLWTTLANKYDPEKVNFFVIYSRERHPGEPGFREYVHTKNDEEKMVNARELAALTTLPVAVDSIKETVLEQYGKVPNPAYVIDTEGFIVFKSTWADVRKVEEVVDTLLARDSQNH